LGHDTEGDGDSELISAVLTLNAVERHEPATLEVAIASPKELSPQKTDKKASRVFNHERRRSRK
jgi:hypothetical protein